MYSGPDTLAGGFPHSEICGSTIARISPQLIAACHVLHRLLAPRHPPNALNSLRSTFARTQYQTAPTTPSRPCQATSQHPNALTTILYATSTKSLIYLSMNRPTRTAPKGRQVSGLDQASQPAHRTAKGRHAPGDPRGQAAEMEAIGFEPTTPCLQSRCSSS